MKNYSKLIVFLVVTMMLFSFTAIANAATKGDVDEEIVALRLTGLKLLTGYEDGDYGFDNTITRAEFAAIVTRMLGMQDSADSSMGSTVFSDVKADAWYTGYINLAAGQGIILGDPAGTFRPNDPVNYAEASAMIIRAMGYDHEIQANTFGRWPSNYLAKAAELGVTDNLSFNWREGARRGDVFIMVDNSLDEQIMEQTQYGSDIAYEKVNDNILSKYHDIEVYDEDADYGNKEYLRVAETSMIDPKNLKANELKFKGHKGAVKYEAIEGLNPNDFLGMEVKAWIDEDDDIVYYLEASNDEDVIVDEVDAEINKGDSSITLDKTDDTYDLVDDAIIIINGEEIKVDDGVMDDSLVDEYDTFDAYIKFGLNDDDEITFAIIKTYNTTEFLTDWTYLVDEVDAKDEVIDYFDRDGAESSLNLDGDDYVIVKNGELAGLEDIDQYDVIAVFEIDSVTSGDDVYYIEVFSNTVEGELTDYDAENVNVLGLYDIYIDGEKYDVARDASLSTDANETMEDLESDDVEDLVGSDVVVYLTGQNKVVHIASTVDIGFKDYGFISKSAVPEYVGGDYTLTITNAYGNEVKFTFDPDDVDLEYWVDDKYVSKNLDDDFASAAEWLPYLTIGDVNGTGKLVPVEYKVNSSGDLNEIKILSANDNEIAWGYEGTIDDSKFDYDPNVLGNEDLVDEDDDTIVVDGQVFNVTDRTIVFDVVSSPVDMIYQGAGNAYEIDDPDVTSWATFSDEDDVVFLIKTDRDEVEAIWAVYAGGGENMASDNMYATVLAFTSTSSGDDAIKLLTPEGEVVTYEWTQKNDIKRRDFVWYTLESGDDEIDEIGWISHEALTTMDTVLNAGWTDDADLLNDPDMYLGEGRILLVDSISGSTIKGYDVTNFAGDDVKDYVKDAGDLKYYSVNSNTKYAFIDDGKMVSKAQKDDLVVLIDIDDDGAAVDYVIIVQDDVNTATGAGSESNNSGVVTLSVTENAIATVTGDVYSEDGGNRWAIEVFSSNGNSLGSLSKESTPDNEGTNPQAFEFDLAGIIDPDSNGAEGVYTFKLFNTADHDAILAEKTRYIVIP